AAADADAAGEKVIGLSNVSVRFAAGRWGQRRSLRAVDDVSLELAAGEALGIVGESGSGKSTLARAALRLLRPTSGRVVWMGRDIQGLSAGELRHARRNLQVVFQDPLASLDPRMTVAEIVAEPLLVHRPEMNRAARFELVAATLAQVALPESMLGRFPNELS